MKPDQPAGQEVANFGDPLQGGHFGRVEGIRDLPNSKPVRAWSRLTLWIVG